MRGAPGVTFLVPVHNGAQWLADVLQSILTQADGRPMEILVVEDGSRDGSPDVLARYAQFGAIRVIPGPQRGAAAALNEGLRHATHGIVCQVDQDVILQPGWMAHLVEALDEPRVAAAQGYYVTPPDGSVWARVMGLDLEDRYRRLAGCDVDHVCTGNTAYRAAVLREIGGFDETLGYGYDNDISYRLIDAGYRLVIRSDARSIHRWRDASWSYLVQQYGFGYGRLDLVAKHRRRLSGDAVSPLGMMLHAPLMTVAVASVGLAVVQAVAGASAMLAAATAAGIVVLLACERLVAGVRVASAAGEPAALGFAPIHLARDLAWVTAIVVWSARRLCGAAPRPSASMWPRPAAGRVPERRTP